MARKKKYPEHEAEAERLMNELLDLIVLVWTGEEEPDLKTVAEETDLSPAKIRKLLITAGDSFYVYCKQRGQNCRKAL